jgi:hypothetical protein
VLELGRAIAREISAPDEHNFSGKWIAHYLAERIEAAKTDPDVRTECVNLILKLWETRRNFPSGDPFEQYQSLLSALKSHLLGEPRFRVHFEGYRSAISSSCDETWLTSASEIDSTSSHLVALLVREAASEAGLHTDSVLELAAAIDQDIETETIIAIRAALFDEEPDDEDQARLKRPAAEDRLEEALSRLEATIQAIRSMRASPRKRAKKRGSARKSKNEADR